MRKIHISIGNCRYAKKWVNKEIGWEQLCEQLKVPKRTIETVGIMPSYRKLSETI